MHLFSSIKRELFYCGLNKKEFSQINTMVEEANRKSLITWSISAAIFWILSLLMSINAESYNTCRNVYIIALIISIITLVCSLFFVKRFPPLLFFCMYLFDISLLGSGIGIALVQPDIRTVTMIVMAVIFPIAFVDRTFILINLQILTIIVYTVLGKNNIVPTVYSWGLWNLLIFSVAGILIGHIINKSRYQRFLYFDSAQKLVDIQKNYNDDLKQEVDLKTKRIITLHNKLVLGMATMVESRDNSTGGHIRRTSEAVRLLLEALKKDNTFELTDEFCKNIIKAAPMHDLGKIAVDDSILRKPTQLTPDEYQEMKNHTSEGARIVKNILKDTDDDEFRKIAENVAHYHHERFDGLGYPKGLKGDEIPLEARIMAIADTYDALVSKRVYKERYPFEKVNQIILEGMGTQFDGRLRKCYEEARPALEAYYASEQAKE